MLKIFVRVRVNLFPVQRLDKALATWFQRTLRFRTQSFGFLRIHIAHVAAAQPPAIALGQTSGNLWGARIAAFLAILNFDWLQVSLLGGAEPLFVLLLFSRR